MALPRNALLRDIASRLKERAKNELRKTFIEPVLIKQKNISKLPH